MEDRKKVINYVISGFGFNLLPINFIEVEGDLVVSVTQKCYIKSGGTFFSKSNSLFSTIPEIINIGDLGLVGTGNVIPFVLRKRTTIRGKLSPFPFKEIVPINSVGLKSAKKREKELDEISLQKRKREFLEKTLSIREEYKEIFEKEERIGKIEKELVRYFSTKWKQLELYANYSIYGFVVDNRGRYPCVGALCERDGEKFVYYIKGPTRYKLINVSKDREVLVKEGFLFVPFNGLEIVFYPAGEPFMEIEVGDMGSFNGNIFPNIIRTKFLGTFVCEDYLDFNREEVEDKKMGDIIGNIKIIDSNRLETLEEETELVISNIRTTRHRGRERYILMFDNISDCYVSNYWLEKDILGKDLNFKLRVKMDRLRTTPTKNKERMVFVV